MAIRCCFHQTAPTVVINGIHLCAGRQQRLHAVLMAIRCSMHQDPINGIHIRSGRQQRLHAVLMAIRCCFHQTAPTGIINGIHIRTVGYQQLHTLHMTILGHRSQRELFHLF